MRNSIRDLPTDSGSITQMSTSGVPTTSIGRASLTSWSSDKSAFGSTSGPTNLLLDQKAAEA
ncbi:hypothetical protein PsorP6_010097 [Peronosclerospora sorghi]|uniref:Uncharacterized protein n=1 Tax=Peronosclerospora sorghi TaxID=230839 RepID=A0ACC0VYR3_9STRA|nr:hypothetical protein PsorP6_010097 [Peronosclerospora sorghi]